MKSPRFSIFLVILLVANFSVLLFKGFPFYALAFLYMILHISITESLGTNSTRNWGWIGVGFILGIIIGIYAFSRNLFIVGIAVVICNVAVTARSIWDCLHSKK